MNNWVKILCTLGIVFVGISLKLFSSPEESFALTSPDSPIPTPTATLPHPRANEPSNGTFTVYLPLVWRPPAPIYLPLVSKAATPTPTPTRTPTPIPNPVKNGGFEQPNDATNGPWWASLTYSGQPPIGIDVRTDAGTLQSIGVSGPHSGNYVAWLGGYPGGQTDLLQQITIPAGGATLRYWTWIQSDEPTCDTINLDGAWLFFITDQQRQVESYALCTSAATSGWVKRDVDLSSYVGQTGWLTFSVRILGENSNLFIDDVSLGTLTGAPLRSRTPAPVVQQPLKALPPLEYFQPEDTWSPLERLFSRQGAYLALTPFRNVRSQGNLRQ